MKNAFDNKFSQYSAFYLLTYAVKIHVEFTPIELKKLEEIKWVKISI